MLNGDIYMSLGLIDEGLFAFFCLQIFDDISLSINLKGIKILPFDASHHGDSNKLCYKFLLSVNNKLP